MKTESELANSLRQKLSDLVDRVEPPVDLLEIVSARRRRQREKRVRLVGVASVVTLVAVLAFALVRGGTSSTESVTTGSPSSSASNGQPSSFIAVSTAALTETAQGPVYLPGQPGSSSVELRSTKTGAVEKTLLTRQGGLDAFPAPHGGLVVAVEENCGIELDRINTRTGIVTSVGELPTGAIGSGALSPNGNLLAYVPVTCTPTPFTTPLYGPIEPTPQLPNLIEVDLATGKILYSQIGAMDQLSNPSWSPNGSQIAVDAPQNTFEILDSRTLRTVRTITPKGLGTCSLRPLTWTTTGLLTQRNACDVVSLPGQPALPGPPTVVERISVTGQVKEKWSLKSCVGDLTISLDWSKRFPLLEEEGIATPTGGICPTAGGPVAPYTQLATLNGTKVVDLTRLPPPLLALAISAEGW